MKKAKSPEVVKAQQEGLLKAVAAGNTYQTSCRVMKVSHTTFQRWREMDPTFQAAVRKAEAGAIMRNVAVIQEASKKHWQAAAWWLERHYPEDWALRQVVAVEESLIADMEKRLHAGRERAAASGTDEDVEPGSSGGNSGLIQ